MPSRDIFTRNNIEKAAEAIRREQRRDDEADTRVRRAMLQEGLDEEDVDLRYRLQDRASDQRSWDGDPIDPDDLTEAELREYATPDEFQRDIPFRGFDVDPDDESYTGYRLASQNPEVLELMRQQRAPLDSDAKRASQNRLFEDIRAGRVNRRDLQTIADLSGASTLLSERAGDDAAYEAASFIEQQRTGNPQAQIDLDLDETVESSLGEASRFITRPMRAADEVAAGQRRLGQNINAARGAVARSSNVLAEEFGQRINRLEAEGLGLSEPQTLEGAERNARRLREITESLQNIERLASTDATPAAGSDVDERTAIRNRILPQVEEALGERGTYQAVTSVLRQQRAERNLASQEQRLAADALRSGPISQQMETLDAQFRRPMSPRIVDELEVIDRGVSQSGIPGLWEQVEIARQDTVERQTEGARRDIDRLLDQYPEVRQVFEASPKSDTRPRARGGESSKAFRQYMDFAQQYASPEDRAATYNAALDLYPAETKGEISKQLQRIESDYTSGNTALQRDAVDQLLALGGDLPESETPAVSPRRPVIGGGRYVSREDIEQDPELKRLVDRIDTRARDLNQALGQFDRKTLRQLFPDQVGSLLSFPKLGLAYDESTGQVTEVDPTDRNAYRVEVMGASRGGTPQIQGTEELFQGRSSRVSENALRFLADNPVLRQSSVSFKTGIPGYGVDYQAEAALPKPVSDVFTSFIQREALKGAKPGTLVANSPLSSGDLIDARIRQGETEATSSILRRLMPFSREAQTLPNLRGVAYQSAGFGPTDIGGAQYTFISPEGEAIPVQFRQSEVGLRGKVKVDPDGAYVSQGALPASSPRYFSTVVPGLDQATLSRVAKNIRRTPASLLPGAADLIPSAEAVRRGYQEGPQALAEQVGRDFVSGLPVGAASAVVLSTPIVAPLAPGIGGGLVLTAAGEAANEAIKQQTGEGVVPKLRQFLGTEERTGVTDKPKPARPYVTPQLRAYTDQKNPLVREAQNRFGLARERFNPAKGEFGLSELLFGR